MDYWLNVHLSTPNFKSRIFYFSGVPKIVACEGVSFFVVFFFSLVG